MRALLGPASALLLAACATAQTGEGKALSAAQDAVAAALTGVHQAYVSGIVPKANVVKASALGDQADDLSKAARTAYAAGDATTAQGEIAQIATLVTEIVGLEKP